MKADDVVNLKWEGVPIPFHVQVKWTGDHQPRELAYDTVIEGAKEHKLTVLSPSLTGMCVSMYIICVTIPFESVAFMKLIIVYFLYYIFPECETIASTTFTAPSQTPLQGVCLRDFAS